jgi:hypothetical protein
VNHRPKTSGGWFPSAYDEYYVVVGNELTYFETPSIGVSAYRIVDTDGGLRISQHFFVGNLSSVGRQRRRTRLGRGGCCRDTLPDYGVASATPSNAGG